VGLGFAAALAIRQAVRGTTLVVHPANDVLLVLALIFGAAAAYSALGLDKPRRPAVADQDVIAIAVATGIATLSLAGVGWLVASDRVTTSLLALVWGLSTTLAVASRFALWAGLRRLTGCRQIRRNVLILGSGPRARRYAREVEANPEMGVQIVGFADDDWEGLRAFRLSGRNLATDLKNFSSFLRDHVVDEVIVAMPLEVLRASKHDPVADCYEQGVTLRILACAIDGLELGSSENDDAATRVAVSRFTGRVEGPSMLVKRCLDVLLSAVLLTALSPVFVLAALAVRLGSPGPVFFTQERVGLNGRTFRMIKFRTMVDGAEALQMELEARNGADGPVFKIEDDPRITRFGRFLRRSSIDELPQVLNVLKGEMSLVGPRPLPLRDVDGFEQDPHRRRFSIRPGLTGLWQVSGRSTLPFEQWIELDLRYVDEWSLRLDLEILLKTIPAVLRAEGAV
jgi:exopolysaccharide biosynthesis polyprenyl glycosylphosphotransferase